MSEAMQYKCPCCGGEIVFDSTSQKMKCPYCDNSFDVETLREYGEEIDKASDEKMEWEQTQNAGWSETEQNNIVYYTCSSCGGEIIGDKSTAATSCPYCGNPVVMQEQFAGGLRPDWVIPFKLDKMPQKQRCASICRENACFQSFSRIRTGLKKSRGFMFRSGCLIVMLRQISIIAPPERDSGVTAIITM